MPNSSIPYNFQVEIENGDYWNSFGEVVYVLCPWAQGVFHISPSAPYWISVIPPLHSCIEMKGYLQFFFFKFQSPLAVLKLRSSIIKEF